MYPAARRQTTTFGRCLLMHFQDHVVTWITVSLSWQAGTLASLDNRQIAVKRTSTVSKSALAITEEHTRPRRRGDRPADPAVDSRAAARATLDGGSSHPADIWSAAADLGWTGLAIAEEHGGSGFGLAELAVVLEAQGRELCPARSCRASRRRWSSTAARRIPFALNYFRGWPTAVPSARSACRAACRSVRIWW